MSINDAALDYMREHALAGPVIQQLAAHAQRQFADQAAWQRHLEQLGITALQVTPDPVRVATEGALWGAVAEHGFLHEAVIVSDDAGQFNVGSMVCAGSTRNAWSTSWRHSPTSSVPPSSYVRGLIWWFYADLKAYCARANARAGAASCGRASTASSCAPPVSPPSIACCSGCMPTRPNC